MYPNLEAELKRKKITRKMLANMLGINIATASAKLTGKAKLSFDEVCFIATDIFKDEYKIEYLFQKA